ncbi:unnamed protein product [Brassica rapa]|uniref:Uncharacterized protein n=2 Tax=Brassica TaxID=3705 RepID=A0A8D9I7J1_BRACM|nr:unnamed protein product [Brassica napus]CAG7888362.1 unnamed protein product [Brassica rapa]CAF2138135.1 unnamed protein product [Brassica napus]CAF2144152.1 unnamed protein product [Brassica napus]CAG7902924.1 unnamed protein product [Brassica rapa]
MSMAISVHLIFRCIKTKNVLFFAILKFQINEYRLIYSFDVQTTSKTHKNLRFFEENPWRPQKKFAKSPKP